MQSSPAQRAALGGRRLTAARAWTGTSRAGRAGARGRVLCATRPTRAEPIIAIIAEGPCLSASWSDLNLSDCRRQIYPYRSIIQICTGASADHRGSTGAARQLTHNCCQTSHTALCSHEEGRRRRDALSSR